MAQVISGNPWLRLLEDVRNPGCPPCAGVVLESRQPTAIPTLGVMSRKASRI